MAESPDPKVLVVFYSRYGATEQVALAAGLGAIQARGSIRLRRLADLADPQVIDADPTWKAARARMGRDYVEPRPADPLWADVIVLATPDESAVEVEAYCASLRALASMTGKVAVPLAAGGGDAALTSLYGAAAAAGLIVVPACALDPDDPLASVRTHGQQVTGMARALLA
jgi:NAD(P)H dehydrogenase (quinone)